MKEIALVLAQWVLGFMIYGSITVLIGFLILSRLDMRTIKRISNFINN